METDVATAIVAAMGQYGVRRLVVTSVLGQGDSISNTPQSSKDLMTTFLRGSTQDKANMEDVVRASDLDWIITRPPILTDAPAIDDIRILSADNSELTQTITRADLAAFTVAELGSKANVRQAVTIANP